jgi:polyferredoxin
MNDRRLFFPKFILIEIFKSSFNGWSIAWAVYACIYKLQHQRNVFIRVANVPTRQEKARKISFSVLFFLAEVVPCYYFFHAEFWWIGFFTRPSSYIERLNKRKQSRILHICILKWNHFSWLHLSYSHVYI